MAFFKFRNRGAQGNEGRNASVSAAPAESVETMRRRARHRLIGAVVLVLVGVIGFPLLFDTQPRPVAVDIPIEIPDRNKVKPLVVPATPTPVPATAADPEASGTRIASGATSGSTGSSGSMITESADGTEIPAGRPAPVPVAKPEARTEPKPELKPKPEVKPEPKPEPRPKVEARPETKPEAKPAAKPSDDGARAKALLDGRPAETAATKPSASDDAGRFAIQVGAFADAAKAKEVRQKLEKAGLKTYTTVAKTADGERTRVRVGPFANRGEADKAAAKVKGLSLSAAVLPL